MRGEPMLEARIDSKMFRGAAGTEREVLRNVTFSIAPGEVVGLLGPSGVGKSTLLRIVLGMDDVYIGNVRRGGGRAGVMFQEPRLLPWMTVADNLRLVVPDGMPQPDIAALLGTVQLGHAAGLYPRQLSLGMARRAALARALAVSPDLLVLDEPFASLDPQLAAALAEIVSRWAAETGGAVLLATHELAQALAITSRVLILSGTPASLAGDVAVPAGIGAAARDALAAKLIAEFSFLGSGNGETPGI
jgi:NitT/TauT family transport system ATP-binding protein